MEKEFLEELDRLFKLHNLDDISKYLEDSLNQALLDQNTSLIITILNEMIGFFRDISDFDTSYKYAKALYNLILKTPVDKKGLFITLINVANAYRAYGDLDNSILIFFKALNIYNDNNLDSPKELASLYNNLSLVYEEKKDFDTSLNYLNKALEVIEMTNDLIKIASTYVNIAMCYISLNDLSKALNALEKAGSIFENKKDDFHYSAYMGALAKYYNLSGNESDAIKCYETALAHLLMTVGKNKYYEETKNELFELYKKNNINPHIKGLKLSEDYFNSTKSLLFKGLPNSVIESLTIGLFGLGSECYGCDDLISEDHDFDPGYIVLVTNNVKKSDFELLKENYNNLNKCFNRFYVMPLDKKGVHYFDEYLNNFLGIKDLNNISTLSKSLITNGKIFYKGIYSLYDIVINKIKKETNYNYLSDLILKTLEINQYIPYNLNRALERNDLKLYELLKNHLIDRLIEYYYIYHKKYLPHDKLQLKLIDEESIIKSWIYRIMDNDLNNLFEEISSNLLSVLFEYDCIKKFDTIYIEDYHFELIDYIKDYNYKREIINKIIDIEWNMFISLENIGGKAQCQSNPTYFHLMRESQFIVWDIELLKAYLEEILNAKEYGFNVLAIKYGFMEETLDYKHYLTIKDNLPKLSDKIIALQEEIIKVQMSHLEEFSIKYPQDLLNMRSKNTSSDNIYNASYETYLRGELRSYSEKVVYLYAKMLTDLDKRGKNIVELTIKFTKLFKTNERV